MTKTFVRCGHLFTGQEDDARAGETLVFDDRSLSLYGPGEVFREESFAFAAKDGFIEWPELGVDLPPDLT